MSTTTLQAPPYQAGDHVEVWRDTAEGWVHGVVADVFGGPVSGQWITVVGDCGYYPQFVRWATCPVGKYLSRRAA